MIQKFVTVDTIFAKIERDYTPNFDEGEIIEWSGEALGLIGAVTAYQEAVCFLEVKNHQCFLPKFLHSIVEIARNNQWKPKQGVTPQQAQQAVAETPNLEFRNDQQDYGYVVLDGDGSPLVEYDVAYYRPYFDLVGDYRGWSNSTICKSKFTKVRLASHNFFSAIVLDGEDISGLDPTCEDTYKVVDQNLLRFSFEKGQIAIAYRRQLTDNKNRPMIPDHASFIEACAVYCAYKTVKRDWFNNIQGSLEKKRELERDWDWYAGQAGNAAMMPFGEDEWQEYTDSNVHLIVPDKRMGYFGAKSCGTQASTNMETSSDNVVLPSTNEITTIVQQGGSGWDKIEW